MKLSEELYAKAQEIQDFGDRLSTAALPELQDFAPEVLAQAADLRRAAEIAAAVEHDHEPMEEVA